MIHAVCDSPRTPLPSVDEAAFPAESRLQQLRRSIDGLDKQGRQQVHTYATLLKHCGDLKALPEGKRVHVRLLEDGYSNSRFIANFLVLMYGKCGNVKQAASVFQTINEKNVFSWNVMMVAFIENGCLEEAENIFNRIPLPNVVTWNAMVAAYAQNGHMQQARSLFDRMPVKDVSSWNTIIKAYGRGKEVARLFQMMDQEGCPPNGITFVCLFKAFSSTGDIEAGNGLHARAVCCGLNKLVDVGNSIINMLGKCGCLEDAERAFSLMPQRDSVSWTTMLTAYTQNGHLLKAKELFEAMPLRTTTSWNAMVTAYTRAGSLVEAKLLFDAMPQRDVVSWNIMITAYTQNGLNEQALDMFRLMDMEGESGNLDKVTLLGVIEACGSLSVPYGEFICSVAKDASLHLDVFVGSALITMFGRCKSVEAARAIFDELPQRNLVCWNSLMAAYTQNWRGKESLQLFRLMDLEGIQVDRFSFLAALDACSDIAALREGQRIHNEMEAAGVKMDIPLETALLNMYAKCGQLKLARFVFDNMKDRNVVTWSAMLAAYAQNGNCVEAMDLYRSMAVDGTEMNEITFVGALFACRHGGLFEEGVQCFASMIGDYSIKLNHDHCINMVDLLGRSGHLEVAEDFIHAMPFEPDACAWLALLGACRMHGDMKRGERIAARLRELDAKDPAPYVLLSNLFRDVRKARNETARSLNSREEIMSSWLTENESFGYIRNTRPVFKS